MDINNLQKAQDLCLELQTYIAESQEQLRGLLDTLNDYQDFLIGQIEKNREVRHIPIEVKW